MSTATAIATTTTTTTATATATATTKAANTMKYRFLGNTGLLVSVLSLGSFMLKERALTTDQLFAIMAHAFEHGVNFFDNAETYADGESEKVMGEVIKMGIAAGTWTREDLVVSTKVFFGHTYWADTNGPNGVGLSRKHIIEGTKASLTRLGLGYVDVLFCHRPDPSTPIEETVRAMNHAIDQGWAFYWGTSEWSSGDIREACEIADRLGLIRPAFDQCEYSILERSRVEFEFANLYKKFGYGLTTYSPLRNGLLTGKYSKGVDEGTRLAAPLFKGFRDANAANVAITDQLPAIAQAIGCSLPQLALAWCISNTNVSTVIMGATSVKQLDENLRAMRFVDAITPEIKEQIDAIVQYKPQPVPQYGPLELGVRSKYA